MIGLVALLFVPTVSRGAEVKIGDYYYQKSETRANAVTYSNQQYPSITGLASGDYVIGWESYYQISSSDCIARIVDGETLTLGGEFLLNHSYTSGWQYGPGFAASPDSGFFAVWAGAPDGVSIQRFDSDYTPIGGSAPVSWDNGWASIASFPYEADVGETQYVVHWDIKNSVFPVNARRYDVNGSALGPQWNVAASSEGRSNSACSPTGRFAITWAQNDVVKLALYESDGALIRRLEQVNDWTGEPCSKPHVVFDTSGRMIVVWGGGSALDDNGIRLRWLDPDGEFLGDPVQVNDVVIGQQRRPSIALDSSGDFVITWCDVTTNWDIWSRLYRATGTPVSPSFRVNEYTSGDQWTTSWSGGMRNVATRPGEFLVLWEGAVPGDGIGVALTTYRHVAPLISEIADVPDDQGGWVDVNWDRVKHDAAESEVTITEYEVQRKSIAWETISTVPATESETYSARVATSAVLVEGQPEPWVEYRVVANTDDPGKSYPSRATAGYSVDNLAPVFTISSVFEDNTERSIILEATVDQNTTDIDDICWYRGPESDFEIGVPFSCGAALAVVDDIGVHRYYRAVATDIHGNSAESNTTTWNDPTASPPAPSVRAPSLDAAPNPFNPAVTFTYVLPTEAAITLEIFSLSGRRVSTLVHGKERAGEHQVVWRGCDAEGRRVASGSYLARLTACGERVQRTLTLLR
jgi:hypothetical protein